MDGSGRNIRASRFKPGAGVLFSCEMLNFGLTQSIFSSKVLDPAFDLHVTTDFGRGSTINTGFFAIKTNAWSANFIEEVWDHNDFGKGQSDQMSINHVLMQMSIGERSKHIKVRSCTKLDCNI